MNTILELLLNNLGGILTAIAGSAFAYFHLKERISNLELRVQNAEDKLEKSSDKVDQILEKLQSTQNSLVELTITIKFLIEKKS